MSLEQGDRPGAKGVYHINAVDEVTQWQIVAQAKRKLFEQLCGLRASGKNEAGGGKGGGNDGGGETLRVSPPPWKSLRDSHIPTASTTVRLFFKFNP